MDELVVAARLLACPLRVELLRAVGVSGRGIAGLAREYAVRPATVYFHLSRLRQAGLVEKVGRRRATIYRWTPIRWTLMCSEVPERPGVPLDPAERG